MLRTSFGKNLLGAVVSATIVLCSAGPAQAAVYKGIWDPTYGTPFPNLGWKGEAFFDVPASCISQAADWYGNTGVCSGLQVLSGTLSFYNASLDPLGLSPLETFTLNPSVTVYEVYTNGTALKGVSTGFFAPVVPSGAAMSIAGGGSYYFDLKFLKELSPAGTPSVQLLSNHLAPMIPAYLSESSRMRSQHLIRRHHCLQPGTGPGLRADVLPASVW